MSEFLPQIAQYLEKGEDGHVAELVASALDNGVSPVEILNRGLILGMNVVGEQFKNHDIFLPDVLMAARAMYAGMDLLKPHLIREGIPPRGRIVIGTVKGDLHDIGKNLVGIMLKGAGYEVVDLGKDVSPEDFVRSAREQDARIIGLSALLTTTMPAMKQVVDLLSEQGLRNEIHVIIGGAPVSDEYADSIGADAYGFDAGKAVEIVNGLLGSS